MEQQCAFCGNITPWRPDHDIGYSAPGVPDAQPSCGPCYEAFVRARRDSGIDIGNVSARIAFGRQYVAQYRKEAAHAEL